METAAIERINVSSAKSACTENTIDIDSALNMKITHADTFGSLSRPIQTQAATAKPSISAGSETSSAIGLRRDEATTPEAAPTKKRGAAFRFWTIHNPNTSQNTQARLSSDGSIRPASILSITVGSVPSACAQTISGRAQRPSPIVVLTNKIGETDYRNDTATAANQELTTRETCRKAKANPSQVQ